MNNLGKILLVGVSSLALVPAAWAQEAPSASATQGVSDSNEIVVSVRRREESIQDVPQVVNAVTSETIEKLNLRKLEDIAAVVPGLTLTPNANGIGSVTTIRGINFDVNQSGNSGTVEFYFNDAPITSNPVLQGMFDVGQIEVQRGPQGTLKGRASPSGSISITTRRPNLSEVGGNVSGTINDIHGFNMNGAINVPVIGDKLGVRIAGLVADDNSNLVVPVRKSDPIRNYTQAGRVSVRADPFDGVLLLDFTYQTQSRKGRFYDQVESLNQVPASATATASPVTITARDRLAYSTLQREANQDFKIFNWSAQLSLFNQKLVYVGQNTKQHLYAFAPSDQAGIFLNPMTAVGTRLGVISDTRSENTSHEIRLQNDSRVAGMFDYVIGYLRYATNSLTSPTQSVSGTSSTPAPGPGVDSTLLSITRSNSQRYNGPGSEQSVFGNVTVHLGEQTELSGGIRHIWYKNQSGLRSLVGATDTSGQLPIGGSYVEVPTFFRAADVEATIYSASIKHNFTRDLMAYASFGTSWRPETVVIGFPTNFPTALQNHFLGTQPETSKSFEAGIKSEWFDHRLRLNVTGYYQKFTNYPYRTPGAVFFIDYGNTAAIPVPAPVVRSNAMVASMPVEVRGLEGEISFQPSRNFSIGAVLSYSDGMIRNGDLPCTDVRNNATGVAGKDGIPDTVTTAPTLAEMQAATGTDGVGVCRVTQRANTASPFSATIQSEYNHSLTGNINGYIRGLYTFRGASLNDPNNAIDNITQYGTLNLYLGLRDEHAGWEVSLYAKNLTDSFRVLSRTATVLSTRSTPVGGASTLYSFTNYYGISVTEPREFGINMRVAFGSR